MGQTVSARDQKLAIFLSKDQEPTKKPTSIWNRTVLRVSEATVWVIVIVLLISIKVSSPYIFDDSSTLWFAGLIISFALAYYTVIYHHFGDKQRRYIKDIADVIFIGILGILAKDYSIYFFSLYILPIAAAALALNIVNSLLVAIFASIFITGNIILNTELFASIEPVYFGAFQIAFLFLLTFFTRALALQLREEKSQRTFFETKLRQVDKKLEDVEAIEQEFVSITTHQLNTPLSIIRGYASMLLSGDAGKLNQKQKRYIDEIHTGSLRLAELIRELLSVTHIETQIHNQDNQPIDLTALVQSSVDEFKGKAIMRSININCRLPNKKITVLGNQVQLEQVLNNLLENAVKYSENNTNIFVQLSPRKGIRSEIELTIVDEGIGIPVKDQERIFQRFYRAANSKVKDASGTGLGLYIVKLIVERHNGSISFVSGEHEGTKFTIRLPVQSSKEKV